MHVSYIILGINYLLNKIKIKKFFKNIISIISLIIFMFLTNFTPSVIRACMMAIIILISKNIYKKNDFINTIFLILFILLIYNPYIIFDIGLQLSFLSTISIYLLNKNISNILINKFKINKKISEILSVSLSAQIGIIPLIIIYFNTISLTFFVSNFFVSFLIGTIIILGFTTIIISFLFIKISKIISIIINLLIEILLFISKFVSKIPFSNIYVITPNYIIIIFYYLFVLLINYLINLKYFKKNNFNLIDKKILIKLNKIKNKKIKFKKILFVLIIVFILLFLFSKIPQKLKIHFIDVGQRRFNIDYNSIKKENINRWRGKRR